MQTVSKTPTKRKQSAEAAKERTQELKRSVDSYLDTLAKASDNVLASATFKAYLDTQARFHRYSWRNCMLIAAQRPNATQVAGFRAWKKLKRHVCKGEHGIRILAPCPWKRDTTDDNGDTSQESGMFFKVVCVFDVAQTEGQELPTVDVPDVGETADTLRAGLERVASDRGIAVAYVDLEAGHFGSSKKGSIDIANGHASGSQAKTLAHELAHETLHQADRKGLSRAVAELEAESVAYVVCGHFGLDTEIRSSAYIALWDGDAKALGASLERIAETARTIIDDVDSLSGRKAVA